MPDKLTKANSSRQTIEKILIFFSGAVFGGLLIAFVRDSGRISEAVDAGKEAWEESDSVPEFFPGPGGGH